MFGCISAMNEAMSPSVSDKPTSPATFLSCSGVGTVTDIASPPLLGKKSYKSRGVRCKTREKETTMTTEANKDLVKRTWQMLLGGNPEGALANFSDDVTWWINGTLEGVSTIKTGKDTVSGFMGG